MNKLKQILSSLAPGFFIIGYMIGTGSVTTMVVAGAEFGLTLTWTILLSCVFAFIVMISISKLTIISGNTFVYNVKTYAGKGTAILIILILLISIVSSVMGIVGVLADIIQAWLGTLSTQPVRLPRLLIGAVIVGATYYLYWIGSHAFFLKVLSFIVSVMGVCFLFTAIYLISQNLWLFREIVPRIPDQNDGYLIISGMVGTTMASVVLVSRSILVSEKQWTLQDLPTDRVDSANAMFLTFLLSFSIMACAAATLHIQGIKVESAIDMVHTLSPLGAWTSTLFVLGIVAAGFSSIIPNFLLFPWLLCDYRGSKRELKSPLLRTLVFGIALSGLLVIILGGRPVFLLILSQALSPLSMPLIICLLLWLLNKPGVVGPHKNSWLMNTGLVATLIFSLFMSFTSLYSLLHFNF